MRYVVNANFNKLLFFVLPITIKSRISKSSNKVKESFEGLFLGVVQSEDSNSFLSMEIF